MAGLMVAAEMGQLVGVEGEAPGGEMEAELGIPIVDSIAVTFLEACLAAGVTPRIKGWGQIFDRL